MSTFSLVNVFMLLTFQLIQDAFVKITKTEGISSLWSGLPPTL